MGNNIRKKEKWVLMSVTNDLVSDQRVHKTALVYRRLGYRVKLIGRQFKDSSSLNRPYDSFRFCLFFNRKMWFYAEYNIRLFFYLLFHKVDILHANDLDTLLPNFLVSKIRNKALVYDSHEYFTEVPELISRPAVRNVWLKIEQFLFPKLKYVYTVNQSIADIYSKKYGVDVGVVRNMPNRLKNREINLNLRNKVKHNSKMLILQGAGINVDRGAEELVETMTMLDNVVLYIIGSGDVFAQLKQQVEDLNLQEKVFIIDRLPYNELIEYTKIADVGLSLDKGSNPNYENSLPNKVFDYIQAGIPLLVSDRKVVAALVRDNNIGFVTHSHEPALLAKAIREMLDNTSLYKAYKENISGLQAHLVWENESKTIVDIVKAIEKVN